MLTPYYRQLNKYYDKHYSKTIEVMLIILCLGHNIINNNSYFFLFDFIKIHTVYLLSIFIQFRLSYIKMFDYSVIIALMLCVFIIRLHKYEF